MRDITPVVFCSTANDWVAVPDTQTPLPTGGGETSSPVRVATLNILADCFPWVVELATCSKLRYQWLTQEIKTLNATVLCFNEATLSAIEHVMADPFVRENYFASEWGNSSTKESFNKTLHHHGCFILSKVPFASLSAFKWGTAFTKCGREAVVASVDLCGVSTVVCATHTTAYQHYHKKRDQQIAELKSAVEAHPSYADAKAFFILGDLNLHCKSEDGIILSNSMLDLWAETHFTTSEPFNDNDPGYTFDSFTNRMIPRYIPGETRRMRLDRILMRQNSMLRPSSKCVIWANHAVDAAHPEVFPSDHYGLSIEVERAEAPTVGSSEAAAVLAENARAEPVRHKRGLYANTVSVGVHCVWLLGRYVGVV